MARSAAKIVAAIRAFEPADGNWRPLDDLFAELWSTGEAKLQIPALFSVLERFPEEDGAGVLWSVVHGLESLPDYEPELVRSVQRQPSELAVTMIGRLLNGGISKVGATDLVSLLQSVAAHAEVPARVREIARDFAADYAA